VKVWHKYYFGMLAVVLTLVIGMFALVNILQAPYTKFEISFVKAMMLIGFLCLIQVALVLPRVVIHLMILFARKESLHLVWANAYNLRVFRYSYWLCLAAALGIGYILLADWGGAGVSFFPAGSWSWPSLLTV